MKHNALAIFGDPGSGKTYFITMIKKLMWNAGHVESHINKTSNFPFENMFNKRIAVINEMNVSQSSIQVVKEILEGKDVCKRNLGNPRRRNQLRTYPLAAPLQQLSSTRLQVQNHNIHQTTTIFHQVGQKVCNRTSRQQTGLHNYIFIQITTEISGNSTLWNK